MIPKDSNDAMGETKCPRCGNAASRAFGMDGLCLRCAGVRVLKFESGTPWEMPVEDKPLDRIGPYEIIEELGRGGMGRVYAARQPGMGRVVALKTIREGLDPELDLRFLREVHTVAALRHPNIVAVHDTGRADGDLYFSMDYIEGGDLAKRLKAAPISVRDTVELVGKVADALAYSHTQGVLHRDLKPSNILMDGAVPKIADFGLAAQLDAGGDLTAATRLLGTPHYLAPEAIVNGSAAQTIASDIYSLGVILFEMLTGRTPFAGASAAELPRVVSEQEAPSLRLLAPAVPRDLENVCLKCLERDPTRRYANASLLADDLRRFLAGEPVSARPVGTWQRILRFGKRHRFAVASSLVVAAVLVAATIVSVILAARAHRAEREAAAQSATSNAVVDFLRHDLLEQAAPDAQPDRDIKLATLVDRSAAKVAERFKDQPEAELAIRETLAATYESLGDYASQRSQLERIVELSRRLRGPDSEGTLADVAEQALVEARMGNPKAGAEHLRAVMADQWRVLGPDHRLTLHTAENLIFIYAQLGEIQKAEKVAEDVIPRCERTFGPLDRDTLAAKADLSSMYFWEGRYKEAQPLNEKVLEAYISIFGSDNPLTLTSMGNLAAVYAAEELMDKAQAMDEKLYEARKRILGAEHPDTLRVLNNLGAVYRENGLYEKAEQANAASYEGRLKLLGPKHNETLMSQTNLAWAKLEKGDIAGARELAGSAMETANAALGADHFATLSAYGIVSEIDRREGRLAEAEQLRSKIYASRLKRGGPENFNTLLAANSLGQIRLELGDVAGALKVLEPASRAWAKAMPGHWRRLVCDNLVGACYAALGRPLEAEKLLVSSARALEQRQDEIAVNERRTVHEAESRTAQGLRAIGSNDYAAWAQRASSQP